MPDGPDPPSPPDDDARPGVLFVSSMRVTGSLEDSTRRRWRGLSERIRAHAVCFSPDHQRPFERAGCRFYPLPAGVPFPVRVLLYYLVVPLIAARLLLSGRVRVLVAQGPYEAAAALPPRLLLGPLGCRLVVEAHGDWIDSFFRLRSLPDHPILRRLLETYSRFVFRRADAFRSISRFTRNLIERHAPSGPPHHTFPTYTNLEPFLEAADPDRAPSDPPALLYAGAMTELKGVRVLANAYRTLAGSYPGLELWMYGEGPLREPLRKSLADDGFERRVRLPGRVGTRRLRNAMLEARMLILPSYTEGLGRVLLESLACGTPVVASAVGGARDLVHDSEGGILVPPGDPESLAEAAAALLEDPDRRRTLARQGHRYIRDHFEPGWFFEGYRGLIDEVLNPDGENPEP